MQFHAIPYNTIQSHTIQYHAIPYNPIQYHTIQYNPIQYHTIQCNTIQYHAIPYNPIHCKYDSTKKIDLDKKWYNWNFIIDFWYELNNKLFNRVLHVIVNWLNKIKAKIALYTWVLVRYKISINQDISSWVLQTHRKYNFVNFPYDFDVPIICLKRWMARI